MTAYQLVNLTDQQRFDLRVGRTYVVGRAVTSDLSLYDPTISRRHAELSPTPAGVSVRDLGSSNGTFINGDRVVNGLLRVDDSITFGKIECQLRSLAARSGAFAPPSMVPGGTIVRQVAVQAGERPSFDVDAQTSGSGKLRLEAVADSERQARKLQMLLDVSQTLSGEFEPDKVLAGVVAKTFEVMNVDRVAILLREDGGQLVPRVSKSRLGDGAFRQVPRSIAQKAVEERIAIMTDNAAVDARFTGQSVLMQSVRSAMCTPLMAAQEAVLGVLYVDSVTATEAFSDEDLQFLIAFSGIAAAALNKARYAEQSQRAALIRSNFERYFAPNVAAEIARRQDDIRPGGEKRAITVLFADIRGFTALSETMTPDLIAQLLTEYFTEMVEIIFDYGGSLDKFIGDAIMAQWGAPIAQDGDPQRAFEAAIAMQQGVSELNAVWRQADRPEIGVGIGINYGEVFAGNIGSQRRLEYTVIGDAVNVASRLCSRAGAGEIIISEPFYALLGTRPDVERVDTISLKGRAQPVAVYRVRR